MRSVLNLNQKTNTYFYVHSFKIFPFHHWLIVKQFMSSLYYGSNYACFNANSKVLFKVLFKKSAKTFKQTMQKVKCQANKERTKPEKQSSNIWSGFIIRTKLRARVMTLCYTYSDFISESHQLRSYEVANRRSYNWLP